MPAPVKPPGDVVRCDLCPTPAPSYGGNTLIEHYFGRNLTFCSTKCRDRLQRLTDELLNGLRAIKGMKPLGKEPEVVDPPPTRWVAPHFSLVAPTAENRMGLDGVTPLKRK